MVVGLDSATPPTAAQAQAAKAAGIQVWSGYLATRPELGVGPLGSRFGLYHPWSQADFTAVKALPGTPIAYASGWDDPAGCKALAAAWNVRLCLDVESGIRADGTWVTGWLAASGAGLYGNRAAHLGRAAAFHILSWYVTDPGATWYGARPTAPCGWQWQNTHNEFGVGVDRSWLDDWFGGEEMNQQQNDWLASLVTAFGLGTTDKTKWPNYPARLDAIEAELAAIKAAGSGKPSAPFDATINPK